MDCEGDYRAGEGGDRRGEAEGIDLRDSNAVVMGRDNQRRGSMDAAILEVRRADRQQSKNIRATHSFILFVAP